MRRKTREQVKRNLVIVAIIVGIIVIGIIIALTIKLTQKQEVSYDDGLVAKNLFVKMEINFDSRKVTRDGKSTTLKDEFDITNDEENLAFSSIDEMQKFLSNSVFDVEIDNGVFTIKNQYQTKKIIVEADEVKQKVEGEEIEQLQDNLYVLSFYSEKLTKAMYNYYKNQEYIKNIYFDEVFINEQINDISQTMYGQQNGELNGYHSLGVTTMGLDNYQKIINENGNPAQIVIATIGYGIDIENSFFADRINEKYYNFILNNNEVEETVEQGSRIGEVLVDSTTSNVTLMPLVTVTEEGYSSIGSIVRAISYATKNSDVICYELINTENEAINLCLEEAFKQNKPVCCVSSDNDEKYPAENGMTIAVSSLNKENAISDYSGSGEYIDFSAPSTDIEEIFKHNSTVSRWSGPQYSNAQIVASIALIKTYSKDATILDVYNSLRNYSNDLGDEGKDEKYGYGMPQFSELKITDIDKEKPIVQEVDVENETWEVLKQVKIKATDNIRIIKWAISRNEENPSNDEWKNIEQVTPTLDITTEVTENGTYYVYVQDSAGNTTKSNPIEISKVDCTPPQIAYTIDDSTLSQGYVTINVTAVDEESGLYDSAYSWNDVNYSAENKSKVVNQNGRYTVYVVDQLGNKGQLEVVVDKFSQEGTYQLGEGNIISNMVVPADWTNNTNNSVKITLNKDYDIVAWQILSTVDEPNNWVEVGSNAQENNSNQTNAQISTNTSDTIEITTSLDTNVTYYLWVKDSSGNKNYQSFTISKAIV